MESRVVKRPLDSRERKRLRQIGELTQPPEDPVTELVAAVASAGAGGAMPIWRKVLAFFCGVGMALALFAPGAAEAAACPGMPMLTLDQRFPADVRRYQFDGERVPDFVELWRSGKRPSLPLAPDMIRVYGLDAKPYVIAYVRADCVMGLLTVERGRFLSWLRPHIGWQA